MGALESPLAVSIGHFKRRSHKKEPAERRESAGSFLGNRGVFRSFTAFGLTLAARELETLSVLRESARN